MMITQCPWVGAAVLRVPFSLIFSQVFISPADSGRANGYMFLPITVDTGTGGRLARIGVPFWHGHAPVQATHGTREQQDADTLSLSCRTRLHTPLNLAPNPPKVLITDTSIKEKYARMTKSKVECVGVCMCP